MPILGLGNHHIQDQTLAPTYCLLPAIGTYNWAFGNHMGVRVTRVSHIAEDGTLTGQFKCTVVPSYTCTVATCPNSLFVL